MRKEVLFMSFIVVVVAGCNKDAASSITSTTNATTTAAAAAPKATEKNVELAPLPLTVKMPSGAQPKKKSAPSQTATTVEM